MDKLNWRSKIYKVHSELHDRRMATLEKGLEKEKAKFERLSKQYDKVFWAYYKLMVQIPHPSSNLSEAEQGESGRPGLCSSLTPHKATIQLTIEPQPRINHA